MGHCAWEFANEADRTYHDQEWGIPVHNDDRQMFEHLTLECLQCGLSWALMLKKREIFRQCFENFEYDKIAAYGEADVQRILNTEGMLRSECKIRAITIYSHLQACGIINDHAGDCPCYKKINTAYPTVKMKPDREIR